MFNQNSDLIGDACMPKNGELSMNQHQQHYQGVYTKDFARRYLDVI